MRKRRLRIVLMRMLFIILTLQTLPNGHTMMLHIQLSNLLNLKAQEQLPITKDLSLTLTSRTERFSDMLYTMVDNKGSRTNFPVFINSSTGIYDKEFALGSQTDDREDCVQNINGRRIGVCEDGIYSFELQSVDAAGNVSEKLSNVKIERDTVRPEKPGGEILPDLILFTLNLSVTGEISTTAIIDTSARGRSWHKEQTLDQNESATVRDLASKYWYSDTEYTVKLSLRDRAGNISDILELMYRTPKAIGSGGGTGSEYNPWGDATTGSIINGRRFPMIVKIDENNNVRVESFTIPEPVLTYTSTDFATGMVSIYGIALNKNYALPIDAITERRTKTLGEAASSCKIDIMKEDEVSKNADCLAAFLMMPAEDFKRSYGEIRDTICKIERFSIIPDGIDKNCLRGVRIIEYCTKSVEISLSNTEIKMFRTNNTEEEITLRRRCDIGEPCHNGSSRFWNDSPESKFIFGYDQGILNEGDKMQARLSVYGEFSLDLARHTYSVSYSNGFESGLSNEVVVKKRPEFRDLTRHPLTNCGSYGFSRGFLIDEDGNIMHNGIDWWAEDGCRVDAIGPGTVVHVGWGNGGQGHWVGIYHDNGTWTYYLHGNGTYYVQEGDRVEGGQHIMDSDNTGNSTGPHLHFELWVSTPWGAGYPNATGSVDPALYINL